MELDEPSSGRSSNDPAVEYEVTVYEERTFYEPCQEANATLYTFLDGELTADRRARIQRHLDECSPCFGAFGFEAELKTLIALKCRDEVPDTLRRRVADALRAEDVPS